MKTIPLFRVHMPESVIRPLLDTLFSGFIGQGEKVNEFERALLRYVQTRNVLSLNSGTTGLHLALHLAGAGPGNEVISTPFTCSATNTAIHHSRARIVWADIDPATGNIDPESVERLITAKTRAVVCVHWAGYPCDLEELNAIAADHGLAVIEDAAHAFGATYKGRAIGSVSDFTAFSLQAIKHITTIDGGLLCCKSDEAYRRGKLLRWYGMDRETDDRELRCNHDVIEAGWKYHMNDISATIGIEQLKYADGILATHRENAAYYFKAFAEGEFKHVRPLQYKDDRLGSYWLFTVLVDNRDSFRDFMRERGVHTSRAHVRNDWHTCFKGAKTPRKLSGVEYFDNFQINIPVHWGVTPDDRAYIMDCIREWDRQV